MCFGAINCLRTHKSVARALLLLLTVVLAAGASVGAAADGHRASQVLKTCR